MAPQKPSLANKKDDKNKKQIDFNTNYLLLNDRESLALAGIKGCRASLALRLVSKVYDIAMVVIILLYGVIILIDFFISNSEVI